MSAILDACREALDLLTGKLPPFLVVAGTYRRVEGGAVRQRVNPHDDRDTRWERRVGNGPWRPISSEEAEGL